MRRLQKDHIDRLFELDFDPQNRLILVHDMGQPYGEEVGVGSLMFQRFFKAFHVLNSINKEPIKIVLNSRGGEWDSGIAIYDLIKSSECHVTIEAMGICASMATVILQAGDERLAHQSTTFMVHDGFEGFEGDPRSFESWAKNSKLNRQQMYEIYASRSKRTPQFWEKRCSKDFIMSAREALELGFIDSIIGHAQPGGGK